MIDRRVIGVVLARALTGSNVIFQRLSIRLPKVVMMRELRRSDRRPRALEIPGNLQVAGNAHRMEVQEDVVKNHQRAVALVILIAMAEDRLPDLVLRNLFADLTEVWPL